MTNITAALVKDLRDKTGAGMMDCKAALTETGGDMEAAIDWLRKKGISKAAKKAGRAAAEGLVGVAVDDGAGVLLEVNAETDFVARNESFQALARRLAEHALTVSPVGVTREVFLAETMADGKTVEATVKDPQAAVDAMLEAKPKAGVSETLLVGLQRSIELYHTKDTEGQPPFRVAMDNVDKSLDLLVEYGGVDPAHRGTPADYVTLDYLPKN